MARPSQNRPEDPNQGPRHAPTAVPINQARAGHGPITGPSSLSKDKRSVHELSHGTERREQRLSALSLRPLQSWQFLSDPSRRLGGFSCGITVVVADVSRLSDPTGSSASPPKASISWTGAPGACVPRNSGGLEHESGV